MNTGNSKLLQYIPCTIKDFIGLGAHCFCDFGMLFSDTVLDSVLLVFVFFCITVGSLLVPKVAL